MQPECDTSELILATFGGSDPRARLGVRSDGPDLLTTTETYKSDNSRLPDITTIFDNYGLSGRIES